LEDLLGALKVRTACRPEFQFDFIYEHASPALSGNRKLDDKDQSETESETYCTYSMDEWLVSDALTLSELTSGTWPVEGSTVSE
jgi:hypothetical protein